MKFCRSVFIVIKVIIMKITISQEGTSPVSITVPNNNEFIKLINSILKCYVNIDKGHGKFHINNTIENTKYGLTKEKIKDGLTKEQVILTAALHDIGLLSHVCSIVLNSNLSKDELRSMHHINGARILKNLYNDATSCKKLSIDHKNLVFIVGNKLEQISHAIEHHRASVQQTEWLDKFIRCCDGLNDHKIILSRAWLYNKDHYPDLQDEQVLMIAKNHLITKYLKNGYGSSMPQKWAVEKFNKEIKLLSDILDTLYEDKASVKKIIIIYKRYFE